jgi:hypothetical protein
LTSTALREPAREPELKWKDAFGRVPSAAMTDRNVVRASAIQTSAVQTYVVQANNELPVGTVQPILLPIPPRTRPAQGPELLVAVRPTPSRPAELRTLEQRIDGPGDLQPEKCRTPHDLKSILDITADISVKPEDLTGDKGLPPECPVGDATFQPRRWRSITFAWTAAATSHNPLYFEDEQLERYGNGFGPVTQSAVSAVRFFATAPLVPYFMGVYQPNEDIYDLGQYRPGSCAPFYLDPLPLSVRGALYEGGFLGILPAL